MTWADVKRQILNLGFETVETYDEDVTILIDAVNRAMREITNIFPLIGEYRIAQYPLLNLLGGPYPYMDVQHYDGKNMLKYAASGARTLYFEYTGIAEIKLKDDDGERTIKLTGGRSFQAYRAFVNENVDITFSGPSSYDIKNIAVYGEKYSDSLADIPAYRKYIRYDFKALTAVDGNPVFLDFLDKVQEGDYSAGESYRSIRDFQVEQNHILVLDGMKKAEYTVFYKKDFTRLTKATPEAFEIELDRDKEHLLPLLAAWYVWADDEPTKAAKWRNDYEDFVSQLLSMRRPDTAQEAFFNDLGW